MFVPWDIDQRASKLKATRRIHEEVIASLIGRSLGARPLFAFSFTTALSDEGSITLDVTGGAEIVSTVAFNLFYQERAIPFGIWAATLT